MRVLSNAPDPRSGGPLKRSLTVARRLRSHGIETVFLVPAGDDHFVETARDEGFTCLRIHQPRIRSPRRIISNLRFVTGFRGCVRTTEAVIDNHDIDIVHVNGPLNFAVARAATRSHAPLVWHFNDTLTPTPLKQLSATLARRWADSIVVAADAVDQYFFNRSTDTTTLYAPVDVDRFNRDQYDPDLLSEEFGIPGERAIVGAVGNINPAKGYEYLIEAFADINVDAQLVIVGRELESQRQYADRVKRLVGDNNLESRVTFTGWRDDIPELLASFDLFTLSSVTEACPMVVLEAMSMECPVVATDVGGVQEQIPGGTHGWVVPPADPESLSAAIEQALTADDERSDRAERARQRAECVFSLETCVEKHVRLYESLPTGSGS